MLNGERTLGFKLRAHRTAPYQKLHDGDYLYLKESSGPLRGRVRVAQVTNTELSDPSDVMEFLTKHSSDIGITSEAQLMAIWNQNTAKRYLCFWKMEMPETAQSPVHLQKRDRRAWVTGYEPDDEVRAAFL